MLCMNNRHDERWEKEKEKLTVNSKVLLPSDLVLEVAPADCWKKKQSKLYFYIYLFVSLSSWLVYILMNFLQQMSHGAILGSRKQLMEVCWIQFLEVWVSQTCFCNNNKTFTLRSCEPTIPTFLWTDSLSVDCGVQPGAGLILLNYLSLATKIMLLDIGHTSYNQTPTYSAEH